MSELKKLISMIYHEKQESGSMLCAQHALNSLLQGAYFTAPDLSEIARNLDILEEQYNSNSEQGSKNMDDTGFFSVQVMEAAIEVWGLNLVRWRSDAMRPYQDQSHKQLAFILNLEQHWFTLRRFGLTSVGEDAGQGHWFNLNSFLTAPEWVGQLYLGMVLQQAEAEGYSVFVVTQADPSKPVVLPRTEADDVAATLPETTPATQSSILHATKRDLGASGPSRIVSGSNGLNGFAEDVEGDEGMEDGDYELQAALRASLESQESYSSPLHEPSSSPPPLAPANVSLLQSYLNTTSRSIPATSGQSSQWPNIPGHADLDPVAASMERNRVLLQRMREQQEYAHRELQSTDGLASEAHETRRLERQRQEEEEEEQLRKAIAESEAMAREWDTQQGQPESSDLPSLDRGAGTSSIPFDNLGPESRNYDDEDAELQAALKASLESAPPGWEPSAQEGPKHPVPSDPHHRGTEALAVVADKNKDDDQNDEMDVEEKWHSESEYFSEGDDHDDDASEMKDVPVNEERSSPPSLDEIRKARLARFGS